MTCRQKEAFLNSWFGSAADGHWSNGMAGSIVDEIDVRFDEAIKEYTRAVPDVPELVRYRLHWSDFDAADMEVDNAEGEYVRYNQAAKVIAAKDAEIERLRKKLRQEFQLGLTTLERAEAAEAKLAQCEAILKDSNAVHVAMLRGDIAKPTTEQINHIYASPAPAADLKAENERLREVLSKSLLTMKRYKNMGYGDEVYMADLCESISFASSALDGDSNA